MGDLNSRTTTISPPKEVGLVFILQLAVTGWSLACKRRVARLADGQGAWPPEIDGDVTSSFFDAESFVHFANLSPVRPWLLFEWPEKGLAGNSALAALITLHLLEIRHPRGRRRSR